MQRVPAAVGALAALVIVMAVSAQSKPDFSGTWKAIASTVQMSGSFSVVQDASYDHDVIPVAWRRDGSNLVEARWLGRQVQSPWGTAGLWNARRRPSGPTANSCSTSRGSQGKTVPTRRSKRGQSRMGASWSRPSTSATRRARRWDLPAPRPIAKNSETKWPWLLLRSATTGSIRIARRAGLHAAARLTATSTTRGRGEAHGIARAQPGDEEHRQRTGHEPRDRQPDQRCRRLRVPRRRAAPGASRSPRRAERHADADLRRTAG